MLNGPLAHEAEDNHGHAHSHTTGQHVRPDSQWAHLHQTQEQLFFIFQPLKVGTNENGSG
jgi:hypothetical protein